MKTIEQKAFVKRFPTKGEYPTKDGRYFTSEGYYYFSILDDTWCDEDLYETERPNYWLEEVTLTIVVNELHNKSKNK